METLDSICKECGELLQEGYTIYCEDCNICETCAGNGDSGAPCELKCEVCEGTGRLVWKP